MPCLALSRIGSIEIAVQHRTFVNSVYIILCGGRPSSLSLLLERPASRHFSYFSPMTKTFRITKVRPLQLSSCQFEMSSRETRTTRHQSQRPFFLKKRLVEAEDRRGLVGLPAAASVTSGRDSSFSDSRLMPPPPTWPLRQAATRGALRPV